MSQKQVESANIQEDYCRDNLDPGMVEKLEAGAFRQLCRHLQQRSSVVANMELMTLAGFCRNCLAKVRRCAFLLNEFSHFILKLIFIIDFHLSC